jgi:hypothetical protein
LPVIARSSRDDIDLVEETGTHELAYTNRVLIEPDGSTHPTTDNSKVINMLEDMVKVGGETTGKTATHSTNENDSYYQVDGMTVRQESMAPKNLKHCKDLGISFVRLQILWL